MILQMQFIEGDTGIYAGSDLTSLTTDQATKQNVESWRLGRKCNPPQQVSREIQEQGEGGACTGFCVTSGSIASTGSSSED
ncbi:hypothetical protein GW7_16654 [Heterocephalus glaber]|uniref:Uncharacterized protein n=1 Tax=Heterocephalus glaber TaxID=10181 RepID=G5BFM6_HETGA|nr:hypothetical protein GW7_16654 [Heterocephalus glaber]